MWEWPPAQRNDLGFKCEMLAQSKWKGAFHSRTGGEVFLFSVLTSDASLRSLAGQGMSQISEIPSLPGAAKSISGPLFPSSRLQRPIVLQGETQSTAKSRQVVIWGEFVLSFDCFLLQYLLGWQVHGHLNFPGVLYLCLAVSQRQKGMLLSKRFPELFFACFLSLNYIARLLTLHEVTWCLRFALNYSTRMKRLGEENVATNRLSPQAPASHWQSLTSPQKREAKHSLSYETPFK